MIKPYLAGMAWLVTAAFSSLAMGHGWIEFPKARQTFCADDGGYWSSQDGSTIPNAACRAAFLESGTYPFVQKNEFSANVTQYDNEAAVRAVVTDGNLCSAGSSAKAGMDTPSSAWQKTSLSAGTHKLKFRVTAPHSPSYWRIYLSKPGFDASAARLNWSDLDLINSHSNLPVVNGYYEMDITIPEGRSGTGILYLRWQRVDAAGEGFYNCSDIAFTRGGTSPSPAPAPAPTPDPEPSLVNIGTYVNTGHNIAEAGDTARFRIFNSEGTEVVDEQIAITRSNADFSVWTRELALKVNDRNQGKAFIGIWHQAMNHLMYAEDNLFSNRVWGQGANYTFSTSVIKADDEPAPVPTPDYEYQYPEGRGSYKSGTVVLGTDGKAYQCKPHPYSGWCNQSSFHYAPGTGLNWSDAWIKK